MTERVLRVYLYAEANDSYVELWKVIGIEKGFIGRFVFGAPTWVYVSDPLGYCEMDHDIPGSVEVIVCTPDGKDLFSSRNGDGSSYFATMRATAEKEFYDHAPANVVPASQEGFNRFRRWLLSFKDKEKYPGPFFVGANDYDENWLWNRREEIKRETICEWDYLGYACSLVAITYRHIVCGKIWTVFVADGAVMGYIFDENKTGPMYTEGEALRIVEEAIRSHFGKAWAVSVVIQSCVGPAQRNVRVYQAAEHLLRGNYRKSFVDRIAQEERRKTSFFREGYRGINDIREIYPGCICDHELIL